MTPLSSQVSRLEKNSDDVRRIRLKNSDNVRMCRRCQRATTPTPTNPTTMTATRNHNQFTEAEFAAANVNPYKVGDGATLCGWSDRSAFTVIKVTTTSITLQRDNATLLNGRNSGEPDALEFSPGGFVGHTSGVQRYAYEANPSGEIVIARMKRKARRVSLPCGEWTENERGLFTEKLVPHFKAGSSTVIPGRGEHYDFNF